MLSLIIPMALLTGYVLDRLWHNADDVIDTTARHVWLTFSFLVMGVVLAGMPLAMLVDKHARFSMIMWGPITGALGLLGLVAVVFSMKRDIRRALVVGICLGVLACGLVEFFVRPAGNRAKPGRQLYVRVREVVGDRPVLVFGHGDFRQLTHEMHAIVLYLRLPHPVAAADNADRVRKRWETTENLAVFSPEAGKDELDHLDLGVRPVRIEDSSGHYLLYLRPGKGDADETSANP